MKIVAKMNGDTYLVSMTGNEVAHVAGYFWPTQIPKEMHDNSDHRDSLRIGVELTITEVFRQNRNLFEQEKKVRDAAGMLRTLAYMIESVGPTELLTPEEPAPAEG